MQIRKLTPNLMVENVQATIDFYSSLLGFNLVMSISENQIGNTAAPSDGSPLAYALMTNGHVEIMFQSKTSMAEDIPVLADRPVGASLSIYLETEGIAPLCERIRPNVRVIKEIFTTWYGMQEFYFLDNNGYVICLAEQAKPEEA